MIRALIVCIFLAGCMKPRISLPAAPPVPVGPVEPVAILDTWGVWSTYAGGGLLVAAALSFVLFLFYRFPPIRKVALFAVAGVTLVISGQIFMWLEGSLKFLSIATLVLGGGMGLLVLWNNRNAIESRLGVDLDRDGKVGA
jgi:hypothetical protein